MSPKKAVKEQKNEPWMLGKFSTKLKVGLVGLPNVGKSSLYNAMSKSHHADAANYPFCTIEPSETRVIVEDERFDWLVDHAKPQAEIHPFLTVVDIAGLIKGASKGEGLGNEFLSTIKQVDGIVHVMRAFEDPDIVRDDKVDPVQDVKDICNELRLKDHEFLTKKREAHQKDKQGASTKSPAHVRRWEEEAAALEKFTEWVDSGKDIRNGMDIWSSKEIDFLNEYMLLTAKPVLFAINLNLHDYTRKKSKFLKPIFDWVQENAKGAQMIPYCGAYECELQDLDKAGVAARAEEQGAGSALQKICKTSFNMVNLIYYFTYGPKEVRAWICRKGFKAPQAAGVIHTDFEHGFICAEVMAYDDLKALGSVGEMKKAGKYRQEGKNYEVQDGDIMEFKFNVTTKSTKK